MLRPAWLVEGEKMEGVHEGIGDADNLQVVKLFEEAGHPEVVHDSTAWCAAFVGAMLARSGYKGTGSLWALDYAKWGQPLQGPALGAIATKKRLNKKGQLVGGHVFFVAGWKNNKVFGLGGNQSDKVCVTEYPKSVIISYRWPNGAQLPGEQPVELAVTKIERSGSEA